MMNGLNMLPATLDFPKQFACLGEWNMEKKGKEKKRKEKKGKEKKKRGHNGGVEDGG